MTAAPRNATAAVRGSVLQHAPALDDDDLGAAELQPIACGQCLDEVATERKLRVLPWLAGSWESVGA